MDRSEGSYLEGHLEPYSEFQYLELEEEGALEERSWERKEEEALALSPLLLDEWLGQVKLPRRWELLHEGLQRPRARTQVVLANWETHPEDMRCCAHTLGCLHERTE